MRFANFLLPAALLCAATLSAQDDLAQYQEWMKAGAAANNGVRAAIMAKDVPAAAAKAADMAKAFDSMAGYWKKQMKDDAVKYSETARDAAKEVAAAMTTEDQQTAFAKARPTCMGCHATYRAGDKFKTPAL